MNKHELFNLRCMRLFSNLLLNISNVKSLVSILLKLNFLKSPIHIDFKSRYILNDDYQDEIVGAWLCANKFLLIPIPNLFCCLLLTGNISI